MQKEILVIEIFDFSKTFIDGEISAYLLLRTLSLCEYVCLVVNRNFTRIMFLFRSIKQITLATSFVYKRHRPWMTFKRCELCELSKFKAQRKLKLFQANLIQFVRLLKLCEIFVRKIYCNKRNYASEKNLSLALTSLMEKADCNKLCLVILFAKQLFDNFHVEAWQMTKAFCVHKLLKLTIFG